MRWMEGGTFLFRSVSLSCSCVHASVVITSTSISIYAACKQSIVDTSLILIVDDGAGLIHMQTFVRERISCKEKKKNYLPHLLFRLHLCSASSIIYFGDILHLFSLSFYILIGQERERERKRDYNSEMMNACKI
jgi:hypothetical protein